MNGPAVLLSVDRAMVSIQSMRALRGFSLSLHAGEMVGLVGRNGAGKTTFMRSVMGLLKTSGGAIRFDGADLVGLPPERRAGLGIGYMPEDRGLVPQLTVEENILLPLWVNKGHDRDARLAFVYGLIPEVAAMRERKALLLSGGQQKLVALARALTIGTRLLLLDEPFEGVAPALSERLSEVIATLKSDRLAVVISQSDMNHSHHLFDREVAIERGSNLVFPANRA